MPEPLPLRPGDPERVGGNRLLGVLGEGGQGVVFLAEAPDGSHVAVKLLRAQFAADRRARRYFAKELEAARRVVAFCTAAVLAADVEGDVPYIVSEYVDAVSLAELVERDGPLKGTALDRLAVGTLNALTAIHQAGLVHRDFKPSNILMAADGPRVIDFGVAKALDITSSMTSGAVGTPAYMAPEQLSGAPVTPAADLFAWAGTMTYAATGAAPFGRDSIALVFNRILTAPPELGDELSGPLRALVEECLGKDPALRPLAPAAAVRLLGGAGAPALPPPAAPPAVPRQAAAPPEDAPPAWAAPDAARPAAYAFPPYAPPADAPPPATTPPPYGGQTPGPGAAPPYGGSTPQPGSAPPYGGSTPQPGSAPHGGSTPQPGSAPPYGGSTPQPGSAPYGGPGLGGGAPYAGQGATPPPFAAPGTVPPYGPPPAGQGPYGPYGPVTTPPSSGPGKRAWWIAAGGAAAAVVLVAGGTALALNLSGAPSPSPTQSPTGGSTGYGAATTGVVNPSTRSGGTLQLAAPQDFDTLDPGNTYYAATMSFNRLWARTLVTYKAGAGAASRTLAPDLASSLGTPSADLKTWTYHLRSGLTFEDGTPITSRDVKYAIARADFAPTVLGAGPQTFTTLLDGAAGYQGPYTDRNLDDLKGIDTPDDRTLVFHLTRPTADFDYIATLPMTAPVPAAKDTGATYGTHPVSSGPYRIESYSRNQSLTLVRNTRWSRSTDPVRTALPDRIQVTFGGAAADVDQKVLAGTYDLDAAGATLDPSVLSKVEADQSLRARADEPLTGTQRFLSISTKVAPFDNLSCRRAVEYAVDRATALSAYGGQAAGDAATHLLPPVISGARASDPYPHDTAKAKSALQACGKPNGFATVIAARSDRPKELAQAQVIQQSLAQVGITASVKSYPSSSYYTTVGSPDTVHKNGLGLVFFAWQADYPSGGGYLAPLLAGSAITQKDNTNVSELNDPTVNGLLTQAAGTPGADARESLYAQADQAAMSAAAIVPLINLKTVLYRGPRLTNVSVSQVFGTYDYVTLGTE